VEGPQSRLRDDVEKADRAVKAIENKLNRLDEAFLFERSIGIETYDRQPKKLARS
jgi:hypothetical protein